MKFPDNCLYFYSAYKDLLKGWVLLPHYQLDTGLEQDPSPSSVIASSQTSLDNHSLSDKLWSPHSGYHFAVKDE